MNGRTDVAFVLDKSGSMYSQATSAINHLNEQIQTLKSGPAEVVKILL